MPCDSFGWSAPDKSRSSDSGPRARQCGSSCARTVLSLHSSGLAVAVLSVCVGVGQLRRGRFLVENVLSVQFRHLVSSFLLPLAHTKNDVLATNGTRAFSFTEAASRLDPPLLLKKTGRANLVEDQSLSKRYCPYSPVSAGHAIRGCFLDERVPEAPQHHSEKQIVFTSGSILTCPDMYLAVQMFYLCTLRDV